MLSLTEGEWMVMALPWVRQQRQQRSKLALREAGAFGTTVRSFRESFHDNRVASEAVQLSLLVQRPHRAKSMPEVEALRRPILGEQS